MNLPIHPILVHFPIALFVTAFLFEMLSLVFKNEKFHQTAMSIYIFATLLTPFVVKTGLWEEERQHIKHPILELHEHYALITMWGSLASLVLLVFINKFFKKFLRVFFVCLTILGAGFVSVTGYYGGTMVYEYGVGVEK